MHHGVHGDVLGETAHLRGRRQLAIEQQIAHLEKIAFFRQFLDGIAAVEKNALVAVNIGDA